MVHVLPLNGFGENEIIRYAASLEGKSEHPLAKAIVQYPRNNNIERVTVDAFESETGVGVAGIVGKRNVAVRRPAPAAAKSPLNGSEVLVLKLSSEGKTPVLVWVDGQLAGVIAIADPIKPTTPEAIAELHAMNIEVIMLTGDNERTANAIAVQAGVDRVIAQVLPHEKASHVQSLQTGGSIVAMVGDGVNDAPALAQADIGIAMGTGTDIAMDAADMTVMNGDLGRLVQAIRLSSATVQTINRNFFWAFAYNVVGIPLAALGVLNPMVAAAAMAFSSVSVVSNSLRLRSFHHDGNGG